jgi:hypothetical protein
MTSMEQPLSEKLNLAQLESHLWGAADILRSRVRVKDIKP